MSVVTHGWVCGYVESFVKQYIDARFPQLLQRLVKVEADTGEVAFMQEELNDLAGRVLELEQESDAADAMTTQEVCDALEATRAKKSDTPDGRYQRTRYNVGGEIVDTTQGRCIVPEERILRWEKIERAARGMFWDNDPINGRCDPGGRDIADLREALKNG